jgi:HTH-type transcriptional regulator, sugar sensing transcriptional regulator
LQDIENLVEAKSLNWSINDGIQYLIEIGLTRIQANLYLNLMLHGGTEARFLAVWTNLPRTEVYRTLNELLEKGLIDRIEGTPLKFSAVPPSLGLQAVIDHKLSEVKQIQKRLKEFTREFEGKQGQEIENNYKITILKDRKRILAKIKQQHDNAKFSIDIIVSLPRFLRIMDEVYDNYMRASERGVKYRILIGLSNEEYLPEHVWDAHNDKNTALKTKMGPQKVNIAIYDGEQTSFSYYPDTPISRSPLIITDQPCLVELSKNSFDKMWNSAKTRTKSDQKHFKKIRRVVQSKNLI